MGPIEGLGRVYREQEAEKGLYIENGRAGKDLVDKLGWKRPM